MKTYMATNGFKLFLLIILIGIIAAYYHAGINKTIDKLHYIKSSQLEGYGNYVVGYNPLQRTIIVKDVYNYFVSFKMNEVWVVKWKYKQLYNDMTNSIKALERLK